METPGPTDASRSLRRVAGTGLGGWRTVHEGGTKLLTCPTWEHRSSHFIFLQVACWEPPVKSLAIPLHNASSCLSVRGSRAKSSILTPTDMWPMHARGFCACVPREETVHCLSYFFARTYFPVKAHRVDATWRGRRGPHKAYPFLALLGASSSASRKA